MGNRRTEKAALKNKQLRWKKQGKLTKDQLASDKRRDGEGFVNPNYPIPSDMQMPDNEAYVPHKIREARQYQHITRYNEHTGGTLFLNRKTGQIFTVRDQLDAYFVSTFRKYEYSDLELMQKGQPREDGWKDSESVPLGIVKRRLLELNSEVEKYQHFNVFRSANSVIDLFFSPKKDQWFYLDLNPSSGRCKRSHVVASKAVAEYKRKNNLLHWVELTDPTQPLDIG